MKCHFTLSSSIPSDGHFRFIVFGCDGVSIGELHLKRPIPDAFKFAGDIYLWDDEDIKAINRVRHPRSAVKLPEWKLNRDDTKVKELKVSKPKPQAPSGITGHLKEWREYFKPSK